MTPNVLALGAAAGGLAVLVRALPWPEAWLHRKPLGCGACLGAWCSFAAVVGAEYFSLWDVRALPGWGGLAAAWLAATGVAALVLAVAAPVPATFDISTADVVEAEPVHSVRCGECGRYYDNNSDRRLV
mgnify:CR=1 FL=1